MAKPEKIVLKRPLKTYQPRLTCFLTMLAQVRDLKPMNLHLWQVMDGSAFQDAETALQVALYNATHSKAYKKINQ